MITRTLPQELVDETRTLEEAYPVTVGVHDLPFTKCDWATENVCVSPFTSRGGRSAPMRVFTTAPR